MKFRGCQTPPDVLQYSQAQHLVSFSCISAKKHTAGQHTGHWCALRGHLSDIPMGCISWFFWDTKFQTHKILKVKGFWAMMRHLLAEERLQLCLWKLRPGSQICILSELGAHFWQNQRWDTWFLRRWFVVLTVMPEIGSIHGIHAPC